MRMRMDLTYEWSKPPRNAMLQISVLMVADLTVKELRN
jgi:hypothetical protein